MVFIEPIGGSKPKFSTDSGSSSYLRGTEESLSLSCPAQGSPVPVFRLVKYAFFYVEPIGGSKPKFSTDDGSSSYQREEAESLSLACPAQGSPIPTFRLVNFVFSF